MELKISSGTSGPIELIKPGTYAAVITEVADIGTQVNRFEEGSFQKEVAVAFYIPKIKKSITKTFNITFGIGGSKSVMRKLVTAFDREVFEKAEKEGKSYSPFGLLDKKGMILVATKTSKSGNEYENIDAFMDLVDGLTVEHDEQLFKFDFDKNFDTFVQLHPLIIYKIRESAEGKKLNLPETKKQGTSTGGADLPNLGGMPYPEMNELPVF